MNAFYYLEPCIPEQRDGAYDEAAQIQRVKGEYEEMQKAYEKWQASGDVKDEVDYLAELIDTMTALATQIWAHTQGDERRIKDVIGMVNLKNKLRGYHDGTRRYHDGD